MTISEKVAYLKGLAEGLNLDTEKSKEGKLISVMIGILEELAMSVEDLEENALNLGEEIDVLSDDLADVESIVYDEDEDGEDYDDDWFEVECPTCGETLVVDDKALADGEVECPECGSRYALDLSDDEEDGESEEDTLRREYLEELGIDIEVGELFTSFDFTNKDKLYHLKAYFVSHLSTSYSLSVHTETRWVTPQELEKLEMGGSDGKIRSKLVPFLLNS